MGIKGFVEELFAAQIGSKLKREVLFVSNEHPLSALELKFLEGGADDVHLVGDTLRVVSGDKSMNVKVSSALPSSIVVEATVSDVMMAFAC